MSKLDEEFTQHVYDIADTIKEINELLTELESQSVVKFQVASYKDVVPGGPDVKHFAIEIYADKNNDECKTIRSGDFKLIMKELKSKLDHLKKFKEEGKNERDIQLGKRD
jgi:hypothetical protein